MTTADYVTERALKLAERGSSDDDAVAELLECCAGKRVSVVLARQRLQSEADGVGGEDSRSRALGFLSLVLDRGQWGTE